jgi:Subtilase family/Fibronectin type-III domain/PA domain/Peptidase inhibitor I9
VYRRAVGLLGGAGLVLGVVAVVSDSAGAAPARTEATNTYIVQMSDLPVAGYTGKVPGYRATRPTNGGKLDARSADAVRYRGYLKSRHDAVIMSTGNIGRIYDYTLSFNGFAARMSTQTASKLARTPGVLSVAKSQMMKVDTVSTPHFLGLDAPKGIWSKLGGQARAGGGKSLVIGDIDSGIWPENPAFRPLKNAGRLDGWHGVCQAGEQWTAANCNNKIVGARFYNSDLGGADTIHQAPFSQEVNSARDINGHGSHTASTAAGDADTNVVVDGNSLGKASGMAPAARIAVYKALWNLSDNTASGSDVDITQAIDDAVSDGVDVINFSVSGSSTTNVDSVETAFLFAADAGVFVSASAGNSGPTAATVAHNDPWVTTVAAGTHDRIFQASVTLGNGTTYTGVGLGGAVPSSPIAVSTALGLTGADPTATTLCMSREWDPAHPEGFLDPAKVAGKIVICNRGVNDRVDKSKAVKEAGGVGVVLANVTPNTLNADFHSVPTVHVSDTDGAAIKAYVNGTANPTAVINQSVKGVGEAPAVASFSSRGPALAVGGDLLKPDIMAPGVDVIAAVSPVTHGRDFDFESGTSMSAPHISGIATLFKQLHPKWSPMMIKSALMTTALRTDNQGKPITTDSGTPAGAFDYGSGQVNANGAMEPGLVYDSDFTDWIQYLCGSGQIAANSTTCTQFGSIDPSDLNTPNIAVGDLAGSQKVTRWVTSTDKVTRVYTPHVVAPAGFTVKIDPPTLVMPAGWTRTYTVTFTRTTATYDQFALGSLDWVGGGHTVHSQIALRPVAVKAPAEVKLTTASGTQSVPFTSGFTGTLNTAVGGLVAGTPHPGTLSNPTGVAFPTANPKASDHTLKVTVTIPAGTQYTRFATFDSDVPAGTDVDLFLYRAGSTALLAQSAGPTAAEQISGRGLTGSFDLYVELFALADGVTSQAVQPLDFEVGTTAAGNLTVSPPGVAVTATKSGTFNLTWSGLTAGSHYVGRVGFNDGATPTGEGVVVSANP